MRPYPIMRYIIPPLMSIWTGKVTGLENLPRNRAFILAANHSSYLEHIMISSIVVPYLNKKLHFLAKKEHFEHILEAAWHRYFAAIPLDRAKGDDALMTAVNYLKHGKLIMIYPEGTRTLTGRIQEAKTGIARLVLWAHVTVVPLGVRGTFEILPKGKIIPRCRKASLHFGRPLSFEKHYNKPITKRMLREITTTIMKEIARLSGQTYPFD